MGNCFFFKSVCLNLVSQPYFLKPYFFSVKCIYYTVNGGGGQRVRGLPLKVSEGEAH